MKPLADFFSRLMPWVPGCPEPTANQALVDSAIAFCEDSLVLRDKLSSFNTVVGQAEYDLFVSSQQQVARIIGVSVNGTQIQLVPSENVTSAPNLVGVPFAAYTTRSGSELLLNLYPTPDAVYPVSVEVALRPTRSATQLEDDLYHLWVDAVVAGAVARICAIPNQPFTDPATSAGAAMQAVRLSNKARIEGSSTRVRGQITVTMRPLA